MSASDLEGEDIDHHKLRKYRSEVKKSRVGKEQKIVVDGQEKMVPHEYFFTMYNAKGEDIGQHWMRAMRPSDQEKKAYKMKYGHDHPITLPVRKKKK